MKSKRTKGKRSRKQLSRRCASKNPDKGVLRPKIEAAKGGDNPIENSGLKKARILWDCILTSCQRLKIGINRQPLLSIQFTSAETGIRIWILVSSPALL